MADATLKEVELKNNKWTKLTQFPNTRITVKNIGGTPVSIYKTDDTSLTINDKYFTNNNIDPVEIGGVTYEISTDNNTQPMYVKAVTGWGKISVRIYGTLDPSEDISNVSRVLNDTILELKNHKEDLSNPHEVTKEQVGLGNLPNAKTDNPEVSNSNILATSRAVNTVHEDLQEHKGRNDNPHGVTKTQVDLGNVQNYSIANDVEAKDPLVINKYMTPYTTSLMINKLVQIARTITPQIVVAGPLANRISGWADTDMSSPSAFLVKKSNTVVTIKRGLQVTYADNHKCMLSQVLDKDTDLKFGDNPDNGIHYVYVNLSAEGDMLEFSSTIHAPGEGYIRDAQKGDFFNISTCTMMDTSLNAIRRVYLGKVWFTDGKIVNVLGVPIGASTVVPVTSVPAMGGSVIINNPFCSPVDTIAQVEYNQKWSPSEWNDQIGVKAAPRPGYALDQIVVQTGLMGYNTGGASSGNAHGSGFDTITVAPRVNVIITKKNR